MELFDFFIKIWNARINCQSKEKYDILQEEFKQREFEYKRQFYCNVYEYSDDFDEDEMYEFARSLRQ